MSLIEVDVEEDTIIVHINGESCNDMGEPYTLEDVHECLAKRQPLYFDEDTFDIEFVATDILEEYDDICGYTTSSEYAQ